MGSALISSQELHALLSDVIIIDASWYMPNVGRDARAEFAREHIKGARFFDLDAVSDKASPFPHMLPSAADFQDSMRALGISNNSDVVVYDTQGMFSAPRLWWMLRVFGHENVRVLDGGLPAWKCLDNSPLGKGNAQYPQGDFASAFQPHLVVDMMQIWQWSQSGEVQIVDARSAARFSGTEPEPRAGVRSGHIPRAKNIHYAALLNADGTMKKSDALRIILADAKVDIARLIATSCGSGVTACIVALALYELGYVDVPVYDGSWAEWGASDLPVEL